MVCVRGENEHLDVKAGDVRSGIWVKDSVVCFLQGGRASGGTSVRGPLIGGKCLPHLLH